jgi:anti-anti-sigma regulatory factor
VATSSKLRTASASYRHIVVDLSGPQFCDYSGLCALLASGVELRLRSVPHSLAHILRLTEIGGVFTIDTRSVPEPRSL